MDARKCKTKFSKIVGERLDRFCHLIGVIRLPGLDCYKRLEFVISAQVVAFQLDTSNHILFPLKNIDGYSHVLLVRGNRHLGRFNAELQVTTSQVVGTQRFNISIQFGT